MAITANGQYLDSPFLRSLTDTPSMSSDSPLRFLEDYGDETIRGLIRTKLKEHPAVKAGIDGGSAGLSVSGLVAPVVTPVVAPVVTPVATHAVAVVASHAVAVKVGAAIGTYFCPIVGTAIGAGVGVGVHAIIKSMKDK